MDIVDKNKSQFDDGSFYDDEENDHEKTYVTVHADSFNEKDFNNFLNCLDTIRESDKKRRSVKKVIKNYCVQVPYIDNSIMKDDDDKADVGDDFERTCDEMKSNISQMFSYFDEDVHLNYDDDDKLNCDEKRSPDVRNNQAVIVKSAPLISKHQNPSESFREKFLRNRQKIKEMGEARDVDSKPIIRGVIKKPNAPSTPNNSLNKNQVDKIMNEFNRVKINYYSKDNYVEFTDIDYFYCDSDLESMRSEKIEKLKQKVLSSFDSQELDDTQRKSQKAGTEVVPKNSVRDKISMFTKLDTIIQPCSEGALMKSSSAPSSMSMKGFKKENEKLQKRAPTVHMKNIIKNTSAANKNQNKCFIKDINNSLLDQVKRDDELIKKPAQIQDGDESSATENSRRSRARKLLAKINSYAQLNDVNLLMKLERIVNHFDMSLLHTIDGLMSDDAFTLVGNRMRHLNVETRPSIEQFNETFDGENIESAMDNIELSVIETNKIQLQMQVTVVNRATKEKDYVDINVIFMAQYETDGCRVPAPTSTTTTRVASKTFFIYFTSLFEVLNGEKDLKASFLNSMLSSSNV